MQIGGNRRAPDLVHFIKLFVEAVFGQVKVDDFRMIVCEPFAVMAAASRSKGLAYDKIHCLKAIKRPSPCFAFRQRPERVGFRHPIRRAGQDRLEVELADAVRANAPIHHDVAEKFCRRIQADPISGQAVMARIEARKQARPAGGTNLTGGEMVGERHAILGDPVNIRCVGNRITGATQGIKPELVCADEDNVWRSGGCKRHVCLGSR